jgi:polar amino acid transport system permease protein
MWDVLVEYGPSLGPAALTTLGLALEGGAVALATALPLGILLTSRHWAIRLLARCWVEVFRGVSTLVALFIFFYVLPLVGIPLPSFQAAALAIGLTIGAYGADVVRGAIESVPPGQSEASMALGMSRLLAMRRIVFPQAFVLMLPSLSSLQVLLLKATALASLVAVTDLTAEANRIALVHGHRNELYLMILVVYFAMAMLFSGSFRILEKRLSRRLHIRKVTA